MTRRRRPRLWTPIIAGVGGSAISLSIGFGTHHLEAIVIGEVVTAVVVALLYLVSREDSDVGAIVGRRVDERQELVRLKAARVSSVVAIAASVVACVVAASMNSLYWPFEVIYIVVGVSYFVGLGVYGMDRHEPDAARSAHEAVE